MTFTRRCTLAALGASSVLSRPALANPAAAGWHMPAEWAPHARCWMAWPESEVIWGEKLDAVRGEIAQLARAVRAFEPVTMVTTPGPAPEAQRRCGPSVAIAPIGNNDLWFRDSGPLFLVHRGRLAAAGFNFNAWGGKQAYRLDRRDAALVADLLRIPFFDAPLVTEGGAIEVDGEGTLIATETSILNPNRNPGRSKEEVTRALRGWLGVTKVIWLPDYNPDYWTDGHIDGLVRFVRRGLVVVERTTPHDPDYRTLNEAAQILQGETDAKGHPLAVIRVDRPRHLHTRNPNYDDTYVNYYLPNGGLIMPAFGDDIADKAAFALFAALHPERRIVQLRLDTLFGGGGGIHCSTQQQPAS